MPDYRQSLTQCLQPWIKYHKTDAMIITDENTLLSADNDDQAVAAYLNSHCQKATTRRNVERDYRKLRIYMFKHSVEHFKQLSIVFASEFRLWLQQPEPQYIHQKDNHPPAFIISDQINPQWRPFMGPLSNAAAERCIANLRALFTWLVDAGYLQKNVWRLLKNQSAKNHNLDTRQFPKSTLQWVNRYLNEKQTRGKYEKKALIQQRWLFKLYLLTGSRVTACTQAKLAHIEYVNQRLYLKLSVKGTGERILYVPWGPSLQTELERYRTQLELTQQQHPYLISPTVAQSQIKAVSSELVFRTIKQLFKSVLLNYEDQLAPWDKQVLQQASPHWLRHASASLLGQYAKEILGHTSDSQTQAYQHQQYEQQIDAIEQLLRQ